MPRYAAEVLAGISEFFPPYRLGPSLWLDMPSWQGDVPMPCTGADCNAYPFSAFHGI